MYESRCDRSLRDQVFFGIQENARREYSAARWYLNPEPNSFGPSPILALESQVMAAEWSKLARELMGVGV